MSAWDNLSDSLRTITSEYMEQIEDIALDLIEEFVEYPDPNRDIYDRLHESIDSHSWVIYTFKAKMVLLVSDNPGAMIDDYGADGVVTDGDINWSAMAFCAMQADVNDWLNRYEVELWDSDKPILGFDAGNGFYCPPCAMARINEVPALRRDILTKPITESLDLCDEPCAGCEKVFDGDEWSTNPAEGDESNA